MEHKIYTHMQNFPSNSDTKITATPNLFVLSPTINAATTPSTTTTSPSLQTLQAIPTGRSIEGYSEDNNESNIIITQPTYNKLLSDTIKQEQVEDTSTNIEYSIVKNKLAANQLKRNNIQQSSIIPSIHINPREAINDLSTISMSMTNIGGHLMSTLNSHHLPDGVATYFVSGLPNDVTSNYKLPPSSNTDLPSPSTSSTSSNPPSSNHQHQTKRHGEGGDPTRKREIRLQKNREAARECRRKKKEYIKCLEERVTGLENQNKALIEELRQLKELYCQRDETNNIDTNNKTTTSIR